MHYSYILYPEAKQRLKQAGIPERVKEIMKEKNYIDSFESIEESIEDYFEDMKERGFFDEKIDFVEGFLSHYYSRNEKFKMFSEEMMGLNPMWKVITPKKTIFEKFEFREDIPLICGYYASLILTPEEFWNPKQYGFTNLPDLWGSIGTLVAENKILIDESYKWDSIEGDKNFITEVTGSIHGDLRIIRTETTPYKTLDPTNSSVSYRPEVITAEQFVAAYHSVEPILFTNIFRWADEANFTLEALKNPKKYLEQFVNSKKYLGPFADAGCNGLYSLGNYFIENGYPMPRLDSNNLIINKNIPGILVCENEGFYRICLDPNDRLCFIYENKELERRENSNIISLAIPKEEANELVFSLFEQTRNGLGRTSFSQMEKILMYTQTPEYKKDIEKNKEYVRQNC